MPASEEPFPGHSVPQGPFVLSGPVPRPTPGLPLRGDVAHIGLAGTYFVPHYAVPQPRVVMPGGADLHATDGADSAVMCTLLEGETFGVLDVTGGWAWGAMSLAGPTGYVHLDRLETLP
ncbi:MAG: hypothetical protein ABIP41_08675 [Croceibacterium sp.]